MATIVEQYSDKPWLLWLLICLCRQEKRQAWLKEIHIKIQNTDFDEDGIVPGHPEWKYNYHGMGLCLSGPNGEELDVDFHDEELRTIDPYFFTTRIFSLSSLELPEARLRHWFPNEELIIVAFRDLQNLLQKAKNSHVFMLNTKFQTHWDYLNQLDKPDSEGLLSKWVEIENLDNAAEATRHQENYQKWLLIQLKNSDLSAPGFEAIAYSLTGETQLEACLIQLRHVNHKMAAAVKVLSTMDKSPVTAVASVLKKLKPKRHHPYLAHTVCKYLLSRNLQTDLCIKTIKSFSDIRVVKGYGGNPYDYELALLMLTYNPEEGIALLRRALRSDTPSCIENTAALMAAINEVWSYRELVSVLEDLTFDKDPTNKRYIVTALMHSNDPGFQEIGHAYLPESRVRNEDDIGYTWDEVVEHNMDGHFQYYIEQALADATMLDLLKIKLAVQKH